MPGGGQHVEPGAQFDDDAVAHDRHGVGHCGHDAQVVRDEDDRQAEVVGESAEQSQDAGLDGDVEGGRRLVRDEDARGRTRWRTRLRCVGVGRR